MADNAPKALPPPKFAASQAAPTAPKDENLKDQTLFAVNQNLREVKPRTTFTPAAIGLIDVSRDIHQELRSHEATTMRVLTPEVMDYYSTALLWMRITDLKAQFGNELTKAEETLLRLAENNPLTVPAPLLAYLKSFGGILTKLESNLYPEFPELPTQRVGTVDGLYGPITEETHNLYEEVPCLGVLAYAVQQVLSDTNGRNVSPLSTADFDVTTNLLGYRPLARRRDDAKSFIEANGISSTDFPTNVTGAMFNLSLIIATSALLRETKTFKLTTTPITSIGASGSQSQTVFLNSKSDPTTTTITNSPVLPSSLT